MRPNALLLLAVCLFVAFAAAWTKEDHEIFRLRDEVAAAEGSNVTFYDLLGVKPSASQDELNKGFRKKSAQLHPDKARQKFITDYQKQNKKKGQTPGVKISKRPSEKQIQAHVKKVTVSYQRLQVISDILKGPERERYDHFLRNGFPTWRGTGYYYQRFRPGLGSVLLGVLVVMGGGMHYFALLMGWRRRREFVQRYIRHARKTAWGDESAIQGVPGVEPVNTQQWHDQEKDKDSSDEFVPRNRREKRAMDKENKKGKKTQAARVARSSGISTPVEAELTSGPQGAKKRIVAENGKVLIVDSVGNVFLEEETEDGMKGEFLLDPDEEPQPTIFDTLLFKLPKFAYNQSVGRILGKKELIDEPLMESSDLPEEEAILQNATAPNLNGEARKRKAKARQAR
ncbi:DNAJ domain-containing protein [Setomelanomma holmii]|uniref:DNAJ domain-containing protein n=1 Tax=Setomelanomma holmii TaxID=210430 RepID=A0A9P4LP96_9PLEO|nr:DNAJ domain-containing protein [Setomelanomma holmii]